MKKPHIKGIIIGMVLGDGCLYVQKDKGKTPHLSMTHGERQEQYARHKGSILEELTSVKYWWTKTPAFSDNCKKKFYKSFHLRTKTHPVYRELYDRFYFQGRKVVDDYLMKNLSEEGLAMWYQDDGSVSTIGSAGVNRLMLCTDSFDYGCHRLMQYWLKKKFGLNFSIVHGMNNGKRRFRLRLNRNEIMKFMDIVSPHIRTADMKYKIFHISRDRQYPWTLGLIEHKNGFFVRKAPVGEDIV